MLRLQKIIDSYNDEIISNISNNKKLLKDYKTQKDQIDKGIKLFKYQDNKTSQIDLLKNMSSILDSFYLFIQSQLGI